LIPQNFKLDRIIDSRTAKFTWDVVTLQQASDPNSGMKGNLAGFIVIIIFHFLTHHLLIN
jgi:hypothetical protein